MTHLVAGALAMATVTLLLGIYLSRPPPSAALVEAQIEEPAAPKADRLPLPVMDQSKLFGQPAMGHAGRPWLLDVPNSGFDSRDGRQEQSTTPEPVAIERIAPVAELPKPPVDPVCGPRGRTYYTKNGWRYWKCVR